MIARFGFIVILVVFNLATLSFAQAAPVKTVLLFGDSIIAGYGLSSNETVSQQMNTILKKRKLGITVVNGGVSGDTTTSGRSRLKWTLDEYHPDIVVLALGGNDVMRGITPEVVYANLESMIKELKSRNILVLLSAVRSPINMGQTYSAEFNEIYPKLAHKYRVSLYPFLLAPIYSKPQMMQSDGIHPTAKGAAVIAEGLVKRLGQGF